MMDLVFDGCVYLLVMLADLVGMTYKQINVCIFVIISPLVTLGLVFVVVLQRRTIGRLRRETAAGGATITRRE